MKRLHVSFWVFVLIACATAAQPQENCIPDGFKPGIPPEQQAERTNASWLKPPGLKWSFQHADKLFDTRKVERGATTVPLERAERNLYDVAFRDETGDHVTFEEFLGKTRTDAAIVLHNGKIVYQYYDNCMKPETHHLLFSASKSFVGLVAAILVSQGVIDENAPVSAYVPDLAGSAYGNATVRQVMDMRVGVKFLEKYGHTGCESDINRYLAAAGWFDCSSNPLVQPNLYKALQNLKELEGPSGECFRYKSPNTDVLAWVVSNASHKSLSKLVSELIWSKIGAEEDAYYLLDPVKKEVAFGGLNVTPLDFARFGRMMCEMGKCSGQSVVPPKVIEDIMNGGDGCKVFPNANNPALQDWSYRSQWWTTHNKNHAYMAMGTYDQYLYIDPEAKLVVAKLGSYCNRRSDSECDPTPELNYHKNAFDALAKHFQDEK
jgi:CubicO group peptidase (beta-lactamase class C family)